MYRYQALSAVILSCLAGCAAVRPAPIFESLSIDVRYQGYGGAARTVSANGRVHGIHASGAPGAPPMISESTEQARPDDLAEIAQLVRDLPESGEIPPPAEPGRASVIILEVRFADDATRRFYRPSDQDFQDKRLLRLQKILYSYRAGYW